MGVRFVSDPAVLLKVGDLVVDTRIDQVSRAGVQLKLPGLSYRLLLALIEAAPSRLTVDDLIDQVWSGKVVSPETVTQRVKLLRRVLDDDAQNPTYIQVIRGGGYHLLVPVSALSLDEPAPGTRTSLIAELSERRVPQLAFVYVVVAWTLTEVVTFVLEAFDLLSDWSRGLMALLFVLGFPIAMYFAWQFDLTATGIHRANPMSRKGRLALGLAGGVMLLIAAGLATLLVRDLDTATPVHEADSSTALSNASEAVIALLPFRATADDEAFTQINAGLNDELRDRLRQFGLKMVARTSSRAFQGRSVLLTDISKQLGAGTLIEGELRIRDGLLTISVAIVDGATGIEKWSEAFTHAEEDLQQAQAQVTRAIVAQLAPVRLQAVPKPAATGAGSFSLLLLARHFEQQVRDRRVVDFAKLERAINLYRQVVAAEPQSALAHSRLAGALLLKGDVASAQEAVVRAMALNPEDGEVQYTLGLYRWTIGDELGGEAFAKAVELNPNHVEALAAHAKWLWWQSDYISPLPHFRRALELDPMSLPRYADLGNLYAWRGETAETKAIALEVANRFETAEAYELVATLYELAGELDEAIAWAWKGRQASSPDVPDATWQLADLYARIDDFETVSMLVPEFGISQLYWRRDYEALVDVAEEAIIDTPGELTTYFYLAFAYNKVGDHAAATRMLELAGLPDVAYSDSRRSAPLEGMATFADALRLSGKADESREVASWLFDHMTKGIESGGGTWWSPVYRACAAMNLNRQAAALEDLTSIATSPALVWEPILQDSRCFASLTNNPTYQKVLADVQTRKAGYRARLPSVLEKHGLSDLVAQELRTGISSPQ